MSKIVVLSERDVGRCLTMSMAVKGVESAYVQKTSGQGEIFPLICHDFVPGQADMDIKSGQAKSSGIFGLKLVSWFGGNPGKGLPALFGTVLLMDDSTGLPLAVMNASGMTGMRTGAAGAVGSKYLARPDSECMLMVGCGAQAPYQIAGALTVMEKLSKVYLYDPMDSQGAGKRLEAIREAVHQILQADASANHTRRSSGYELVPAAGLCEAVSASDIIVTATPSRQPLIKGEWLRPGTHISCVGADMPGKQELDPGILIKARVFADDLHQTSTVGECELALKQGMLGKDCIRELGSVIEQGASGRCSDEEITVFDSSGIALQDLIVAKAVLDRAVLEGIGTWVEL